MIIAVTSQGSEATSPVDMRFGRCGCFLLYDDSTKTYRTLDNKQNLQAVQGAGVQAAQNLIDNNISVLLTGNLGPKAFQALAAHGIQAFQVQGGTVEGAVKAYQAGGLSKMGGASMESHAL